MRARLREILDWVAWTRDAGFDYISTGQHFLANPYEAFQPLPLLARLAPETGDMRLVATILMPLHQPVELAELTATVDVITGGRLTISASRGYREEMAHFAYCVRMWNQGSNKRDRALPRCHGRVAMADAIIALSANLAMRRHQRIEFKPEWFDAASPEVPDPEMKPEVVA